MDEKPKPETLKQLSDEELYSSIVKQDTFLANLTHKQQEEYKQQNVRYSLAKGELRLGYFGAKHIFEPGHLQFEKIQADFQTFIEGKDTTSIIVLVEGAIPKITQDINQDIHETGERGFITHMAIEIGMKVECIEPDRIVEMSYLLQNFRPEDIEYYYYLRGVRDYFRSGRIQNGTSFEEYSQQLLDRHRKMFGALPDFSDFAFTLEHMKTIHRNITDEDFDVNRRLDVNPRKQDTIIGQIAHATSSFRDFYHVRKIEQCLDEGYSVFIVNGEDHAVIQRGALEQLFSE